MELFEQLMAAGEYYAAGLFEYPQRSTFYRYSNAFRRHFENAAITPYAGGKLFPNGLCTYFSCDCAVFPHYSYSFIVDEEKLARRAPFAEKAVRVENARLPNLLCPHTVGGSGYTHSFLNYPRILAEGLNGYRRRVEALDAGDFRDGLLLVLDAIETYRQRCLAQLQQAGGDPELIAALSHTPNLPPRSAYEALVAWNFVYYVDGCDDIGRLDKNLAPYWKGEDLREVLRQLFRNIDDNGGWSGALGPD